MTAVLLCLLPGALAQTAENRQSHPTVTPMFLPVGAEGGLGFFVECRNTTNAPVSSGSAMWAMGRSDFRVDGNVLEETGGSFGPGLTSEIQPGATWRGIIELRESPLGRVRAVTFGANVRTVLVVPLTAGRHTIAVRCAETWSSDLTFYVEK